METDDVVINGTITLDGVTTHFQLIKDVHGYPWSWNQWGDTQRVLGERVDLLEQMVHGLRYGTGEE